MVKTEVGLHNLTCEEIREVASELEAIGVLDDSLIYALASFVIINTLGFEFFAKECTTFRKPQNFFEEKNGVKTIYLAHMLWSLKNSSGFANSLNKNDLLNFESVFYELTAASWFLKESESIEFVMPIGVKGRDFDILAKGYHGPNSLNVEVKSKRRSFSSGKQLRNYLSEYRKQLPANEKGAIFCKILIDESSISESAMISETQHFLQNTERVSFVTYCWDATHSDSAVILSTFSVGSFGLAYPFLCQSEALVITPSFMSCLL